ncbi:MAG: hypothetical protein Kow0090_23300 [Myxococcota bacterium]
MGNRPVLWMSDEIFGKHDPGYRHPESAQRFYAIEQMSKEIEDVELIRIPARRATEEELLWVHRRSYIDIVNETDGRSVALDPDTHTSPDSVKAAYLAAGGSVEITKAVLDGKAKSGFANVRPPGHHAESNRAAGFCIFNNVAIAGEYAIKKAGLSRVAIIDPDGHHGNGTMHHFYERKDALYISIHRYPFYPGTGTVNEVGRGGGEGFTVNIPFDGGMGDAEYLAAFDRIIIPVLEQYEPQLVLVSAGFDAHESDPLVGMNVTTEGFGAMMSRLANIADKFADGRIIGFLEGGYNTNALAESVHTTLRIFSGARVEFSAPPPSVYGDENIRRAETWVKRYWNI